MNRGGSSSDDFREDLLKLGLSAGAWKMFTCHPKAFASLKIRAEGITSLDIVKYTSLHRYRFVTISKNRFILANQLTSYTIKSLSSKNSFKRLPFFLFNSTRMLHKVQDTVSGNEASGRYILEATLHVIIAA